MSNPTRQIFDAHALRCTRQREVIYSALAASHSHPTAEDLFSSVRAVEPGLSLATVYNTLEALTDCGLARRIPCPSGSGACRYDADMSEHAHIATPDGRVMDVPHDLNQRVLEALPTSLVDEIEKRTGVRVRAVNVQFITGPAETTKLGAPVSAEAAL
jgi:Fur family peroxide stress response transcriptional regulator